MDIDPNEEFAGNASINASLHEILASATEPSRSRMRRKIVQDKKALLKHRTDEADAAARHTYREFLVAHKLNRCGFSLEYSATVDGLTPDWYDTKNALLLEVLTCERGGRSDPVRRMASRITDKVHRYQALVSARALRLVIALHGDFVSGVDCDDCEKAIRDSRLFDLHPDLSGVIFFVESNILLIRQPDGSTARIQQYAYHYFGNLKANRPIDLTSSLHGA